MLWAVLWIECLHPIEIHMLKPCPQCDGLFRSGAFQRELGLNKLMDLESPSIALGGIGAHLEDVSRALFLCHTLRGQLSPNQRESPHLINQEVSPETKWASALCWTVQSSELQDINFYRATQSMMFLLWQPELRIICLPLWDSIRYKN